MKSKLTLLTAVLALSLPAGGAWAQNNADTHQITFEATAINELAFEAGSDVTLIVSEATAGAHPDPATSDNTRLKVTTNESDKQIIVGLDSNLDAGLTLSVLSGSASLGAGGLAEITSTNQTLFSNIGPVATDDEDEDGIEIAYTLEATVQAGVVSGTRTITYTLSD